MEREDIEKLIEKLRHKSGQERRYGAEKCAYFDRVAGQIEEYIDTYEDDRFETEEDIIEDVNEIFNEDDFYTEEDYENMDMLD